MHRFLFGILPVLFILAGPAQAQTKSASCAPMDRPCLMKQIEELAPNVDKDEWRDQTYRELAKTYAYEGETGKAIALIGKIKSADTKAMTIRGIGMAAASMKWDKAKYDSLFEQLAAEAKNINHPPSQGIAYTYIAMAQAFAGDNDGARKTASGMENAALRNKAYGETAEIQAERGDLANVVKTLAAVDSQPYRSKAYDTVSRIFLDKAMIAEAYTCANSVDNAYLKAKSIQRILNKGNTEEEDMEPKEDLSKGFE